MSSTLRAGTRFLFALLPALVAPAGLRAQTAASPGPTTSQAVAKDTVPLGRYVAKEHLAAYLEFRGLDAHAEAWKNTAACKMLNDTPLGEMLTEVSSQLLDKALEFCPNHRLNGAELVTLLKNAARSGWVIAIHVPPSGSEPCRGTLILRGATNKELRPLSGRLMGWLMGDASFKQEVQGTRKVVVVTPKAPAAAGDGAGWVWWPEKDDLVVGFLSTASAAGIAAALDGKTPSALEHPLVQELAKPAGKFQPVCVGFADTANCPENTAKLTAVLRRLNSEWGIKRIDLRWGFDGDALMAVTRLAAPKPRRPALAIFDEPAFEKTSLLSMPDGVESFVEVSMSFSALLDTIKQLAPSGSVRETIEELAESIHNTGSMDLQKDLLAHLGPKMAFYLAPGRSAATNEDSLEAALSKGWSLSAGVAAVQAVLPKLTVVAEVKEPTTFAKALDAAIIAINGELKAQAIELAAERRKEEEKKESGGAAAPGRGPGGRGAPGGERTKRRRSLQDTPSPRFQLVPTSSGVKSFVLTTPSESPIRLGPSSFRPTLQLDGRYLAFAVSPEAARSALAAARRKDWKPSSDAERAWENAPAKLSLLSVTQVSDGLSSLLASLPGTLQTMINTSITLAKGRATENKPADGTAQASASGAAPAGGPESRGRRGAMIPGASASPGGASRSGRLGPRGGFGDSGGGSAPSGSSPSSGAAGDSMIALKVESDKLPKSTDLKGHLFASTLVASATDEEIQLISRGAFPNLSLPVDLVPVAAVLPAAQSLIERLAKAHAAGTSATPASGSAQAAGGAQAGAGTAPAAPAGAEKGASKSGRRGRRP
jgi:hypothetical protein